MALDTESPLTIAAYAVSFILAVPTLLAITRLIYFVAAANEKLGTTAIAVSGMSESMKTFKHEVRNELDSLDKRVLLVERDVERFVPPSMSAGR